MRLGKLQRKALEFAQKTSGWQSFSTDSVTKRVIKSLVDRGLLEVNEFNQFRMIKS